MRVIPHYQPNRKSPWEARWYVDRKLKSRFFQTEKERDKFIRSFSKELNAHGEEVFKFDKEQIREWKKASIILPHVSPMELVDFWLDHHDEITEVKLSEGFAAHLKSLEQTGRDANYRRHAKLTYERFTRFCGDVPVHEVTTEQVTEFIHARPYADTTKNHTRSFLNTAFKWFKKSKWLQDNPVEPIPPIKVTRQEPGILTVEETKQLFAANQDEDPEICGLLALGAFGGMRASAIERLSHGEIKLDEWAILTPAEKTKKRRRNYIEGLPENLWLWLERTPASAFKLTSRQITKRREKAFIRAGLLVTAAMARKDKITKKSPPRNCLRHSFATYHVALHRDPGNTALLISHKNQNILYEHYLGVATKKDAKQYFEIKPKT
ncbi:MAG: tyrosine-type recombinase/integrase [Lentimonas sp.]